MPCCKLSYFGERRGGGGRADYFSLGSTVKMENVGFCIIFCFCLVVPSLSEPQNRMFQLWQPRRFCWCKLCASAFRNFPHYYNCENIFRCAEELTLLWSECGSWFYREMSPPLWKWEIVTATTRNGFALCRFQQNFRGAFCQALSGGWQGNVTAMHSRMTSTKKTPVMPAERERRKKIHSHASQSS